MTEQTLPVEAPVDQLEPHQPDARPAAKTGFLDRPLLALLHIDWEIAIWILIFLAGAALRFYMLDRAR